MNYGTYIVYHMASTVEVGRFDTDSGAKRSVTCKNRKAGKPEYAFNSLEFYQTKVVRMIKRTNLMTGKEYFEPSNTPTCCSPASETYDKINILYQQYMLIKL